MNLNQPYLLEGLYASFSCGKRRRGPDRPHHAGCLRRRRGWNESARYDAIDLGSGRPTSGDVLAEADLLTGRQHAFSATDLLGGSQADADDFSRAGAYADRDRARDCGSHADARRYEHSTTLTDY